MSLRKFGGMASACLIALAAWGLPTYGQQPPQNNTAPAMGQYQDEQTDKMSMQDEEVAHPFFTHMGVPEAVGVFNLRLAGLATRVEGRTEGDFAFHFETGLTEFIGLHVRKRQVLGQAAHRGHVSVRRRAKQEWDPTEKQLETARNR